MKKIIAVALCIMMIISVMPFTFAVSAEEYGLMSEVYVSESGKSNASGLEDDPCTLERAFVLVKDGGTIHIDGTVVASADFRFTKSVTIVGDNKDNDVLDLSATADNIVLGGDITFDYVTLKFNENNTIYASGYALVVGENCATVNAIYVYGGKTQNGVVTGDTSVTLLSGTYKGVYGGGYISTVQGNTNVVIGGSANVNGTANEIKHQIYGAGYGGTVEKNTYVWLGGDANRATCTFTESSHDSNIHYVFGGGFNCNILGSTNVTVTGNAIAHYVYGGMHGDPENFHGGIKDGSNVIMTGGRVYGIYGASAGNTQNSDVNVIMTGGTVSQIIGGASGSNHVGNVNIKLLGGTVTRRIFGGCYNDRSFSWASSYYVDGLITLTIAEKANVQIDLNQSNDNAFTAHSRRSSVAEEEDGVVVFTSEEAKNDYLNAFNTGESIVGTGKPAYDSYSVKALLAGDANLDGEITNADVLAIMKNIYNEDANPVLVRSVADVNGDEKITNLDLLKIYKQIYAAQ